MNRVVAVFLKSSPFLPILPMDQMQMLKGYLSQPTCSHSTSGASLHLIPSPTLPTAFTWAHFCGDVNDCLRSTVESRKLYIHNKAACTMMDAADHVAHTTSTAIEVVYWERVQNSNHTPEQNSIE
jgi:hypothetical protein